MCGLLGRFTSGCDKLTSPKSFGNGLDALSHRGPDDFGCESFTVEAGYLELGHRRLAIIDLTPAGRQPMCGSDERFVIVFNGNLQLSRASEDTPSGGLCVSIRYRY